MSWKDLSASDKALYEIITKDLLRIDEQYIFSEHGEPLYFHKEGYIIPFEQLYPIVRKIIRKMKLRQINQSEEKEV